MKRLFSLFLSVILMLTLAVPAFGAETVKFKITVVSENATQAVISIDYDGGSSFSCLDFEIALSSKLSVVSGGQSAGLKAFRDYAEDKGAMAMGAININSNPIKASFLTTAPFEAVKGKDLYKLTLKKSTADKITKNDIKVTVTNCGISKTASEIADLTPSLSYTLSSYVAPTKATTKTTAKSTTKTTKKTDASKQTTTKKASETTKAGETTTLAETTTIAGETTTLEFYTLEEMITEDVIGTLEDNDNELEKSKEQAEKDKKKIILIGVGAACCVIVIAGVLIYVVKKAKKEESIDE